MVQEKKGENTQHAKKSGLSTPQINCAVASFLTFLASKKLFQDFELPLSKRRAWNVSVVLEFAADLLIEPDAFKNFSAQCTTHLVAKLYS